MRFITLFWMILICFRVYGEVETSESYLDFWEVEIGDSEYLDFEVINYHPYSVEIQDVELNADYSAFDLNENCLGELGPGESCSVEVSFSPYEVDYFSGEVEVEVNTGEWISVDIEGEGTQE